MISSVWGRVVGFVVFSQLGLVSKGNSTQQYPVFTSPKLEVPVNSSVSIAKPPSKLNSTLGQKAKSIGEYKYNGFITVNDNRRFFINAKPLSQHVELKLVSVVNAGRILVLQHRTRGRINLHLGQTTTNKK